MRLILSLLVALMATEARADSYWLHNGSEMSLEGEGASRKISYIKPRSGLPVSNGTVLFEGQSSGTQYSGTAYVFSSRCGPLPYLVSGGVVSGRRSVVLQGRAPSGVDRNCNVSAYKEDSLVFTFNGCGCSCDHSATPELATIFPPERSYAEGSQAAYSCPYLYAWNEQGGSWHEYGKVIKEARGRDRHMTETVQLTSFATRFRLAEEEPEQSFIDAIRLLVVLKDGSRLSLLPRYKGRVQRSRSAINIPAFGSIEFSFELPPTIDKNKVDSAALSITGYYEDLPYCPPQRNAQVK